jgi:hypothetical protein
VADVVYNEKNIFLRRVTVWLFAVVYSGIGV